MFVCYGTSGWKTVKLNLCLIASNGRRAGVGRSGELEWDGAESWSGTERRAGVGRSGPVAGIAVRKGAPNRATGGELYPYTVSYTLTQ